MAAGQQRKRLTSSNLHEHYKGKKKKRLNSTDHILNLRSHVYLQWDEGLKRVVAKREQIGITWKDMAPYIDSMPKLHSGLADVFSFPEEVFDLDNLMEVLSHEVWATCLSDSERKLLMLFLPGGASSEQAVHSLLSGENLHFGNAFLKWSTLLCSGDLHPDVIHQKEQQTKANKNQYYREINTYHTDMVEVLRMWKEKSATFKDSEKLWRKLSYMNNRSEGVSAEKPNGVAIPKKELPPKIYIRNVDVAKYMSYIKVNKQQFEMAKELKHSGDGIQSKSLNHVLGDIKSFQIYPYESYEDEKRNKLQGCWMQVTKDIPAAFEEYNYIKLQNVQQTKCLEKELAESRALILDKAEKPVLGKSPEVHMKIGKETDHHSITNNEDDSGSSPNSAHDHSFEHVHSLNGHQEFNSTILDQETGEEHTLKPAKDSSAPLQSDDNMNTCQAVKELKPLILSSNSTRIPANPQNSYYRKSSGIYAFASSCNLPLNQCQPVQERAPTIDLEREIMEQDSGQHFPSAFNAESTSMFSSYSSQSHDELIPAFPEAPEVLSSHPDEHINALNQPRVQLFLGSGNLRESDRFSHLEDNQRFNKGRQACEKELYMQHMIDNNFSTNSSYDQQGYYESASSKGFPTLQSSAVDGFGRHNMFPNEHQSHNGWSGIESSGNSASADGSLFSVVSEYRNLPSQSSFDTSGSEQLMQARNYIGMGMADQYISDQFRRSTVHNASPTPLDMMWMNYSHQNSVGQESVRKSFPSPWQQ